MSKPILVIDFDGVLHSYASGWQGADVISDPPVPGAQDFCAAALQQFDVYIVSSRCSQARGMLTIDLWLEKNNFPPGIKVVRDKPAAQVTIDDRALTFNGEWPSVDSLLQFKPWYKRG